jgi:DNA-binding CsgD family transcriptional regulator
MDRKIGYYIDMDTGCHICFSHRLDRNGYPQIKVGGRTRNIHRYLYECKYGKIQDGLIVRHTCDNRACINIQHLELGSHQDNMNDMVLRGRSLKGSKNAKSKLNEEIVLQILASDKSNSELSKMYGVTYETIRQIRKGMSWKHIYNDYYRIGIPIDETNTFRVSSF